MSSPKVILIDIETLPNVGFCWGKYEQNILAYVKEWELASFAWKELGRGKVEAIARPDFKDPTDVSLVKEVRKIIDTADVLIGHNIDGFDSPMLRVKFVSQGMQPTSYKTVDTLKISKSQFRFNSNKLDDLAKTLKIGRKIQTNGFELWQRCIKGDAKAWVQMAKYNKHDVVLLEKVYQRLRSWYPSHPNFALYSGEGDNPECPTCESLNVIRRGFIVMVHRRSARFQCKKCGKWFSRPLSKAEK